MFVSYTQVDERWASWIGWELRSDGWHVDIQLWDVVAGDDFVAWMHTRLETVDHLVLVVSGESLASGWVGVEWRSVYRPGERRVVPVRVEQVDLGGLLQQIVHIDLFDLDEDEARDQLRRRMRAAHLGGGHWPSASPAFPGAGPGMGSSPLFPGVGEPSALLDRVAAAVATRHPTAVVRPVPDAEPVPYLDVDDGAGDQRRQWAVGVLAGRPLDAATLTAFRELVHRRYEAFEQLAESDFVCADVSPSADLARLGRRSGILVHSLASYEGRWDPADYLTRQRECLEQDPVYPADLYVAQRYVQLDGPDAPGWDDPPRGEDLCAALVDWLDAIPARFLLVLGDFGHGKSFLLRELARRLPGELPRTVPMLVELRDLEKSQSIDDLLALHLAKSGQDGVSVRAVRRMLDRGQIVLLFDGFDELAMRVTFDRAADHLAMIASAVSGRAKIVLTSRTQHFASDDQWRTALGDRVHRIAGSRTVRLEGFDEARIRAFLTRLLARRLAADQLSGTDLAGQPHVGSRAPVMDSAAVLAAARRQAELRFDLISNIRDLLGLSENPRMLSFIAELDERELRAARDGDGRINSADLYDLLLWQWLDYEARRRWPSPRSDQERGRRQLFDAVRGLALHLWLSGEDSTDLDGLAASVRQDVADLSATKLGPRQAVFAVGSGSLLVRNEDDRFQFVHRSVLEYLVAVETARRIDSTAVDGVLLGARSMSALVIDFLVTVADGNRLAVRVRTALSGNAKPFHPQVQENLFRIARRLGLPGIGSDLSGQDLRGEDLSVRDLRSANLRGANLAGLRCHDLDLSGADLSGADLRDVRLTRVRLSGTLLAGSRWTGALLIEADLDEAAAGSPELAAAAVVGRDPALPQWMPPRSHVSSLVHGPDGRVLAALWTSVQGECSVVLHDTTTLQPLRVLAHGPLWLRSLAFAADGGSVIGVHSYGSSDGWSVPGGTRLDRSQASSAAGTMRIAAPGSALRGIPAAAGTRMVDPPFVGAAYELHTFDLTPDRAGRPRLLLAAARVGEGAHGDLRYAEVAGKSLIEPQRKNGMRSPVTSVRWRCWLWGRMVRY